MQQEYAKIMCSCIQCQRDVLNEFQSSVMVMGCPLENMLRNIPDISKLTAKVESMKKALSPINNEKKDALNQLGYVTKERCQLFFECSS